MCDLCRLIFGLVVDLFRSRAALEAEVLVLKQQIIVSRSTRYRGSVAPCRLPVVLALEVQALSRPSALILQRRIRTRRSFSRSARLYSVEPAP
ncbi:MAG: hypothetical protein WB052_18880, partial [Pseudolabrys sp.]